MLFTDGSADSRDRSGGWAWVAIDAFIGEHFAMGGDRDTTNNRMEMTAWIEGLSTLYEAFGPCHIIVASDSEYVGLGAMDRVIRKRRTNLDLWVAIDAAVDLHWYVEYMYIRGHRGDPYNELADKLAGEARIAYNYPAE